MGCNFNLSDSIQLCSEASSDSPVITGWLLKLDTLTLFLILHGGGDYRGMKDTVLVLALMTGCCSGVLSEALSFEAGTGLKDNWAHGKPLLGESFNSSEQAAVIPAGKTLSRQLGKLALLR